MKKMDIYIGSISAQQNQIVEGFRPGHYNINFTFNEQIAIGEYFSFILEKYAGQLMIDEGLISEDELLTEGIIDKVKEYTNKAIDGAKDKMDTVKNKLSAIWKLIKDFKNKAIKTAKDFKCYSPY